MQFRDHDRRPYFTLIGVCLIALAAITLLTISASTSSAEQGQYLHFGGPGSGYLEVPDSPELNPASEITIEAWVRIASGNGWGTDAAAEGCPAFVGKNYESSYWLGLACAGSTQLQVYVGGGEPNISTGSLPLNEWVHIAVTYDASDVRFYINGVLDSTIPNVSGLSSNTDPLRIGQDVSWDASPIGDIDEVHIWNTVRSAQSILADMQTITTPQIGLVGVWNMEGSPDSSVGGFSGSLVGNVVYSGVPLTPSPTQEPPYNKGDTNCDHGTNLRDALTLLERLASITSSIPPCENPVILLGAGGAPDEWWDASSGNGFIQIPHHPDLNPTNELTIELWVNLWSYLSPDSGNVCQSLVGKGYQTSYFLGICSGLVRFSPTGFASRQESLNLVPLRQWTHIAVSVDEDQLKIYINGALDSESNDPAPLGSNDQPLRLGSDPSWNFQPWAALDDVRIWNKALTQEEIAGVMSNPPVLPPTGLVAQYSLDGNAEDTANDHEGGAVGTVKYGTALPPPYWHDINCDGFIDQADLLLLVAYLGDVGRYPVPNGCEPIGTSTG
jgi:hypothetical protein